VGTGDDSVGDGSTIACLMLAVIFALMSDAVDAAFFMLRPPLCPGVRPPEVGIAQDHGGWFQRQFGRTLSAGFQLLKRGTYSAVYVPLNSSVVGNLQSLWLPALSAGLPVSALLMQMTRAAMLDVLSEPFIVTARASGIKSRRIYYRHALKAALVPILSLEGFTFGILIGSLIVVEDVFSLPGLGRGLLNSFGNRDFVELEGQILVLGSAFIVGNLIVDVVLPLIDKRLLSR